LIFKGDNDKSQINNSSTTVINPTSHNLSEFTGDKSLANDAYKIFLAKKYTIEKNDALGKIIVKDKLFESIDEALSFADSLEKSSFNEALIQTQQKDQKERLLNDEARQYNITQIGNKYLYKTYQYDELVDAIVFAKADQNSQEPINDAIANATKAEAINDELETKSGLNFLSQILFILFVLATAVGALWYYSLSEAVEVDYVSLRGKPASILFETKGIKSLIANKVGHSNVNNVSNFFDVAGPNDSLKKDGIYLVGSGCMPHDCADSEGLIFVNTQNNDVVIVTTTASPPSFTAYGMEYNEQSQSFNKTIPPLAKRWLRGNNIRLK
jgi:hypothetical protein